MSQSFNDPFSQNPNAAPGRGTAQDPNLATAQDPNLANAEGTGYGGPGSGGPPPKSSSPLPWILGILGILGLFALLCCGGLVFVGYQAQGKLTAFTGEIFKQQFEEGLNANADFAEHMGEVESMSMDLMAIGEVAQENPDQDGPPWLVFSVKGTKGDGTLRIQVNEGNDEEPTAEAVLVLEDGSEFPMTIAVNQDIDPDAFGIETEAEFEFDIDEGADFSAGADAQPAIAP